MSLEAAEKDRAPEHDRAQLQYRLGIAGFHTPGQGRECYSSTQGAIDQADDPVEAYTVLPAQYLNLDKPDLEASLDANLKLRNLPQASEEALARLACGRRIGTPVETSRPGSQSAGEGGRPGVAGNPG